MIDPIELVGWAAAGFTFAAYAMKTMLPLRMLAIFANVAFITYSAALQLYPTLVLHLMLLPFNTYRLGEIFALRRRIGQARRGETADFSVLAKSAPAKTMAAGTQLFARGDAPDHVYFIASGEVELTELGLTLGAGQIVGEIAFFTGARMRTASARCLTACHIHAIDEAAFLRLYFQDPTFGLAIMRLITDRLVDGMRRAPAAHPGQTP